jgi:hypothetical protein
VDWAPNPPGYYGSALDANHITDLELKTFTGQPAHPTKQPAIVIDGKPM